MTNEQPDTVAEHLGIIVLLERLKDKAWKDYLSVAGIDIDEQYYMGQFEILAEVIRLLECDSVSRENR